MLFHTPVEPGRPLEHGSHTLCRPSNVALSGYPKPKNEECRAKAALPRVIFFPCTLLALAEREQPKQTVHLRLSPLNARARLRLQGLSGLSIRYRSLFSWALHRPGLHLLQLTLLGGLHVPAGQGAQVLVPVLRLSNGQEDKIAEDFHAPGISPEPAGQLGQLWPLHAESCCDCSFCN